MILIKVVFVLTLDKLCPTLLQGKILKLFQIDNIASPRKVPEVLLVVASHQMWHTMLLFEWWWVILGQAICPLQILGDKSFWIRQFILYKYLVMSHSGSDSLSFTITWPGWVLVKQKSVIPFRAVSTPSWCELGTANGKEEILIPST